MDEAPKRRAVVALFASPEERAALNGILVRAGCAVHYAATLDDVAVAVSQKGIGVVLCENQLSCGCSWRDVLAQLQDLPLPPALIVADRLADEALWAEVLNLGGYDLLVKPFDPTEVARVVELALLWWESRIEQPRQCSRKSPASTRGAPAPKRAASAGPGH
jgi:DNA-binding NtrC family response regulator